MQCPLAILWQNVDVYKTGQHCQLLLEPAQCLTLTQPLELHAKQLTVAEKDLLESCLLHVAAHLKAQHHISVSQPPDLVMPKVVA